MIPRACGPDNFVSNIISNCIPDLIPNSAATRIRISDHRDREIKFEIKFGIESATKFRPSLIQARFRCVCPGLNGTAG